MRIIRTMLAGMLALVLALPASAQGLSLHVQRKLAIRQNVNMHFTAPPLPEGGYYYAVVVLRAYKHYTRHMPPPCSTSSNMQRTDYGYPASNGVVTLALTPATSHTQHWCRDGAYEGAVYAVPHQPPCNSSYPCVSEPYESPKCAVGIGPPCLLGSVAAPDEWEWPDPLPTPHASATTLDARFSLRFPKK